MFHSRLFLIALVAFCYQAAVGFANPYSRPSSPILIDRDDHDHDRDHDHDYDRDRDRDRDRDGDIRRYDGNIQEVHRFTPRDSDRRIMVIDFTTQEGRKMRVDMGPARRLEDVRLNPGDRVIIHGYWVERGDRRILMATRVRAADGQTRDIR